MRVLMNSGTGANSEGGIYIPPYKAAQLLRELRRRGEESIEWQKARWDALRKSINGLVNKVTAANIRHVVRELMAENLVRGRGLFCRSCIKSQMASPLFTDVFAALLAVINTKFPEVGALLLKRIVLQLKMSLQRNDRPRCLAAVKFIAHLVNQQVANEILALELVLVLLENPTDDSVEVAVGFLTECGSILQDLSPKGLDGAFERLRGILHEGLIDKRVQFLVEGLFALRRAKFRGHPAVPPELDLVEPDDQFTHEISLDDCIDPETGLDILKPDPHFLQNEERYQQLKQTILGEDDSGVVVEEEEEDDDDDNDDDDDDDADEVRRIQDHTDTDLVNLRRTIYLTIMSSLDFEEAGHKLLQIQLQTGQEMELCVILVECCIQKRTYRHYYGLLAQRFCVMSRIYRENFERCFAQQYSFVHRLETNKLRNAATFFAHLLAADALSWHTLAYIRLTEEDTTSSSCIFIKFLFQQLHEHLGIHTLYERLTDTTMQESFQSIFPTDNTRNTTFAINFFMSIGLGAVTENLPQQYNSVSQLRTLLPPVDPEVLASNSSDSGSNSDLFSSDKSARRRKRDGWGEKLDRQGKKSRSG